MDFRGVPGVMKCKNKKQKKRNENNKSKESIKVVYISTPMKVKTSASRFRSLVQELTGQDSDVTRIMESNGATEFEDHEMLQAKSSSTSTSTSLSPSPSSSLSLPDSFMEPNFDDLFSSQMEEQFLSLFGSNAMPCAYSPVSEIDILGTYDAL